MIWFFLVLVIPGLIAVLTALGSLSTPREPLESLHADDHGDDAHH